MHWVFFYQFWNGLFAAACLIDDSDKFCMAGTRQPYPRKCMECLSYSAYSNASSCGIGLSDNKQAFSANAA